MIQTPPPFRQAIDPEKPNGDLTRLSEQSHKCMV